MSITSDANHEVTFEESNPALKVVSYDVNKVGRIYTNVPVGPQSVALGKSPKEGRVRLLNYFNEIEKRIATEVESRKSDIVAIRIKMSKNRAYNVKARKKMKAMLLTKMAVNAKRAKDDLDKMMRKAAAEFHKAKALENLRHKQTMKRARQTRKIMRKNKRQAASDLADATANQQRALSALDSQMNEKITQTNKHIGANAAQIKINAKKARDDLDAANVKFNKKMFNVENNAKKDRSRLSALSIDMNKRTRAMIAGEVNSITTKTAAEFAKVRSKMAADRARADAMLKETSTKLSAALHTSALLQNKRFKETVSDISEARKEANDMINKMKSGFKVQVMHLSSVVKDQVTKLNGRVTQLQGVVTKNKMEQALVNRKVSAEIKRMVKTGNDHEATLAGKDKELSGLIKKNKDANEKAMMTMAKKFSTRLNAIKKQMKKDRAHAESNLHKETTALYKTLADNRKLQMSKNKELNTQRALMENDAKDALREAKKGFAKKIAALTSTVVANDKKADRKIKKLTGIVDADAVKNAEGRKALKLIAKANKAELKTSVRNAIHKGEMRALQVEKLAKDTNQKTRDALNMRITADISKLTKSIHGSIEDLRLNTKAARKEMKREILYAVRAAASDAKKNLAAVVKWSNKEFNDLDKKLEKEKSASAIGRKALKDDVEKDKKIAARAIGDAVSNQNRALLALKTVTQKKIKKTNKRVDAYGKAVEDNAKAVEKQMAFNIKSLKGKLESAKQKATKLMSGANDASMNRKKKALGYIEDAIIAAGKKSDLKFSKVYIKLGRDRERADDSLSRESLKIQESIAKRSALYDTRFQKTVKNIKAAREQAGKQVKEGRAAFTSAFVSVVSTVKEMETRITANIQIVGTEVASLKAQQVTINRKTDAELKRISDLSDTRFKEGRKARGALRKVIEDHKAVAYNERKALEKSVTKNLKALRSFQAKKRGEVAADLTKATKGLYSTLTVDKENQANKNKSLKNQLKGASVNVDAALGRAKQDFAAKLMGLTNVVGANQKSYERGLQRITGVVHDWKKTSGEDRKLLKEQTASMEKDLQKAIVKAIAIGEAKAKAVQERGMGNISSMKKAMSGEIAEQVETMADEVFKATLENRGKIADNYLALKAYAGAMSDEIIDYTTKYQGKGLFSLGDLLGTVAAFSNVKTKATEGIGAGGDKVNGIFDGKLIPVPTSFTKANGLVSEWTKILSMVRSRWPYGLGHYLLGKVQFAMQKEGILTVGSVPDQQGEYVYVNPQSIGLANRLAELSALACRSARYQTAVVKLAAKLPKAMKVTPYTVPAGTFKKKGWGGQ